MKPRVRQLIFLVLGALFGVIALVPSQIPAPSSGFFYVLGGVVGHLVMAAISLFCLYRGWRAGEQARREPPV